jgi:hypothetical protein
MNAGLSSLTFLKSQLLAERLRDDESYDAALTAIGQGVAAAFDRHCNRHLARAVDDEVIFPADRLSLCLPRYPVAAVTSIEVAVDYATGFADSDLSFIASLDKASGLLNFTAALGGRLEQGRITYTGGYWFDTSEDASGTLPTDATALPADILLAWIEQCKKVWEVYDPQGTGIAKGGSNVALVGLSLAGLELLPTVKQTLAGHVRYAMA